ncbi:hypothetical protein BHE74_00008907 [Ensete ventricosum]|nr:hypothetical protein BHE74_00008907 [Ensete ventricosum]
MRHSPGTWPPPDRRTPAPARIVPSCSARSPCPRHFLRIHSPGRPPCGRIHRIPHASTTTGSGRSATAHTTPHYTAMAVVPGVGPERIIPVFIFPKGKISIDLIKSLATEGDHLLTPLPPTAIAYSLCWLEPVSSNDWHSVIGICSALAGADSCYLSFVDAAAAVGGAGAEGRNRVPEVREVGLVLLRAEGRLKQVGDGLDLLGSAKPEPAFWSGRLVSPARDIKASRPPLRISFFTTCPLSLL